jgi:hypothetical protein
LSGFCDQLPADATIDNRLSEEPAAHKLSIDWMDSEESPR